MSSLHIDVSSAEWIVEAPSNCGRTCQTLPLADFGKAAFASAGAQTTAGQWGSIANPSWATTEIRLSPTGAHSALARPGQRGPGAAEPSALGGGGSSFTVFYGAAPPSPGSGQSLSVTGHVVPSGSSRHRHARRRRLSLTSALQSPCTEAVPRRWVPYWPRGANGRYIFTCLALLGVFGLTGPATARSPPSAAPRPATPSTSIPSLAAAARRAPATRADLAPPHRRQLIYRGRPRLASHSASAATAVDAASTTTTTTPTRRSTTAATSAKTLPFTGFEHRARADRGLCAARWRHRPAPAHRRAALSAARAPVLINARAAVRAHIGGVERLAREMAFRLPALRPERYRVIRPPPWLAHRAGPCLGAGSCCPRGAPRARSSTRPPTSRPLLFPRNALVIHDAAALRHPEAYSPGYVAYQRRMLPALARRARL